MRLSQGEGHEVDWQAEAQLLQLGARLFSSVFLS